MTYYKLKNDGGSYIDDNKIRFDIFCGSEVFFPESFTDYCTADILSEALTQLGLKIYQDNIVHYDKLKVKEELSKIEFSQGLTAWQYIKTQLTDDQCEDMLLAPYFSFGNDNFKSIVLHFKSINLFDVDSVLNNCVI